MIVSRTLVGLLLAVAATTAATSGDATQIAAASSDGFAMRVVTTGLANPFQVVWGPDDYLWVTERTGGRVVQISPRDGTTTAMLAIGDALADGPGGLLGMALD